MGDAKGGVGCRTYKGAQKIWGDLRIMDMFIILTVAVVSRVYTYVKTLNYVLSMFHFTIWHYTSIKLLKTKKSTSSPRIKLRVAG